MGLITERAERFVRSVRDKRGRDATPPEYRQKQKKIKEARKRVLSRLRGY